MSKEFFSAEDFNDKHAPTTRGQYIGAMQAASIASAKVAPLLEALEVYKAALKFIEDGIAGCWGDSNSCVKWNHDEDCYCLKAREALARVEEILKEKE